MTAIFLSFVATVQAKEIITVVLPYNPGYSGQPGLVRVIEQANLAQSRFNFQLEFKPGAGGELAYRHALADKGSRVVMLAPGSVDLFETGKIVENDWVPIHAVGDSCGAIITNWPANEKEGVRSVTPPNGAKNINIGIVGAGSVSHLAGLEVARRLKVENTAVPFKSGREALVNLAGDHGVNITVDSVQGALSMQSVNSKVKMIATMCDQRHPMAPHVPTVVEQKIDVPPVFNIVMAHKDMPAETARSLGAILDQATKDVGRNAIFESTSFLSPVFKNVSTESFYKQRIGQIKSLRKTYIDSINVAPK